MLFASGSGMYETIVRQRLFQDLGDQSKPRGYAREEFPCSGGIMFGLIISNHHTRHPPTFLMGTTSGYF